MVLEIPDIARVLALPGLGLIYGYNSPVKRTKISVACKWRSSVESLNEIHFKILSCKIHFKILPLYFNVLKCSLTYYRESQLICSSPPTIHTLIHTHLLLSSLTSLFLSISPSSGSLSQKPWPVIWLTGHSLWQDLPWKACCEAVELLHTRNLRVQRLQLFIMDGQTE